LGGSKKSDEEVSLGRGALQLPISDFGNRALNFRLGTLKFANCSLYVSVAWVVQPCSSQNTFRIAQTAPRAFFKLFSIDIAVKT
jgi:hypothetical protein